MKNLIKKYNDKKSEINKINEDWKNYNYNYGIERNKSMKNIEKFFEDKWSDAKVKVSVDYDEMIISIQKTKLTFSLEKNTQLKDILKVKRKPIRGGGFFGVGGFGGGGFHPMAMIQEMNERMTKLEGEVESQENEIYEGGYKQKVEEVVDYDIIIFNEIKKDILSKGKITQKIKNYLSTKMDNVVIFLKKEDEKNKANDRVNTEGQWGILENIKDEINNVDVENLFKNKETYTKKDIIILACSDIPRYKITSIKFKNSTKKKYELEYTCVRRREIKSVVKADNIQFLIKIKKSDFELSNFINLK